MKQQVIVCGDSFNCGIGCPDIPTQFYGALVAKGLDHDLVTLARGSASNFTIYLQAKYVADNPSEFNPGLVIIGTTSTDRLEWVSEPQRGSIMPAAANQINYHQYPPHLGYVANAGDSFYFKDKPNYQPRILSEQMQAIDDYLSILKDRRYDGGYYRRLRSEPSVKLKTILDYHVNVLDENIKLNYDMGVIFTAYSMLKKRGIRTILLMPQYLREMSVGSLIDDADFLDVDWFQLAVQYPDTIGTQHASEEAHALVADWILQKVQG